MHLHPRPQRQAAGLPRRRYDTNPYLPPRAATGGLGRVAALACPGGGSNANSATAVASGAGAPPAPGALPARAGNRRFIKALYKGVFGV